MRKLIYILLILPIWVHAQTQTTTIPGYLKIKKTTNAVVAKDSALTIDTNGNVKRGVLGGGGGSSTGINGLNGTTTIGLGGNLANNTTITSNGYNLNFNQLNSANNIVQFQFNGTTVANVDVGGTFYMSALRATSNVNDALMTTRSNGFLMSRNRADSTNVLTVVNKNPSSAGAILTVDNAYRDVFTALPTGMIRHTAAAVADSGQALGYYMTGALAPSQNGDNLIGMVIAPTFGVSTIATVGSLVGGTGYSDGTFVANLSGGTGKQASGIITVSGGVVTTFNILVSGINYTVGDVLTIVSMDGNTPPHGTGATVTVTAVNTYTGINKYAIKTYGRDIYDQDYSASYSSRDKVDKGYADTHISGVLLSSVTQGLQLAPKMTTTQKNAIVSPQESWVVYDTTLHAYQFYNGTSWQTL